MKILLLNPPPILKGRLVKEGRCQARAGGELWPPVTLAIISALLEKNGFDSVLFDGMAEDNDFKKFQDLLKNNFDFVILNSSTLSIYDDLECAKMIKDHNINTKVAFYGTHVTALPNETLANNQVDFVIRNEPEIVSLELTQALSKNKSIEKIKGLSFRKNNKIINNPNEFIKDLNKLPYANLKALDNNKYRMPKTNEPFTIIRSSRGCPFQCMYCTSRLYYGSKWRTRTPENVVNEIERDVNEFGIRNFLFNSDTFNLDKKWVLEFTKLLQERKLDIRWMSNSRVDTLNKESLEAMKKTGNWLISFGFESGSQTILNNMRKGITLEQSEQANKLAQSLGIETIGYFMFGTPGETKETIKETIAFAKKLKPNYARFFSTVPFPGTELFDMAEKNGWIKTKDWSKYDQADSMVYELPTIKSKDIVKNVKKAYLSYYLRPSYAWNQLKGTSLKEKANIIKSGVSFLKEWIK